MKKYFKDYHQSASRRKNNAAIIKTYFNTTQRNISLFG